MSLREYQEEAIENIRNAFKAGHKRVCFVLPTGGGKTRIFSHIVRSAAAKGKIVWVVAHRRKLLKQAAANFEGLFYSFVNPNYTMHSNAQIQICSIQTLINRLDSLPPPDLIICDECHHAVAGQYLKLFDYYPNVLTLGVTATPSRLDGKGLGAVFDVLVKSENTSWLIENGYLCKYKYYSIPSNFDISKVKIVNGEFSKDSMDAEIGSSTIIGDAVKHYREFCDGMPAIAFCSSIKKAKEACDKFIAGGYRAVVIHGKTPVNEQDKAMEDLASGAVHVVCSCDLIGEGVDVPVAAVCIMLRATKSLVNFLQWAGRVLRKAEGKEFAYIFDHVGNWSPEGGGHGFPCDEREWSLEGSKKRSKKKSEEEKEIRRCDTCKAIFYSDNKNPRCGLSKQQKDDNIPCGWHAVTVVTSNKIDQVEYDLERIDPRAARVEKYKEEWQCKTYEDFKALAQSRGYKPAWAGIRWQEYKAKHKIT